MLPDRVAFLHTHLQVKFIGEEGVDEGGVQKEFFQLLVGLGLACCGLRLGWLALAWPCVKVLCMGWFVT